VFLLVLAHPGSPGQRAVKRSLLSCVCVFAQDYEELSSSLSELPLNDHTASELVRLCLRHHDAHAADDESDAEDDDVDADDEVV